mmetsp:Transcript_47727/g.108315  ORF Transcript_47727/g.108315 Transcript_47727/m.108315 type:complete len:187 (-) Transcript_47727:262-822(-)
MAKAAVLLGLFDPVADPEGLSLADQLERFEEPQTVRYNPGEAFSWHLDALPPSPELVAKGGQRVATLLVYLRDLPEGAGGATTFRDLGPFGAQASGTAAAEPLAIRPTKGTALLFFPSAGGLPNCPFDIRALHAGEVVSPSAPEAKWIAQLWVRQDKGYRPTAPKGTSQRRAAGEAAAYAKTAKWA